MEGYEHDKVYVMGSNDCVVMWVLHIINYTKTQQVQISLTFSIGQKPSKKGAEMRVCLCLCVCLEQYVVV